MLARVQTEFTKVILSENLELFYFANSINMFNFV